MLNYCEIMKLAREHWMGEKGCLATISVPEQPLTAVDGFEPTNVMLNGFRLTSMGAQGWLMIAVALFEALPLKELGHRFLCKGEAQ